MNAPGIPQFGRVPYAIINGGAVACMKPADAKVYLVLCAHADGDWTARPGQRRIAELSGLGHGSVGTALRRLAALGLIQTKPGSGRRTGTYRLCALWAQGAKGDLRPTPAIDSAPQRDDVAPYEEARSALPAQDETEEQIEQKQEQAAAADVHAELKRLGVGEPTRSKLAQTPGASVATIHEALRLADATRTDAPAGVVVKAIRAKLSEAVANVADRERQQAARVAHEAQRKAEAFANAQRIDAERAEATQRINAASDEDLAKALERVIAAAPVLLARRWQRADPRKPPKPLLLTLARELRAM